ncbi:hypothetical protein PV05_10428 [Exophiala xenobiotica]|uniref:SMP domain-containing protein n=1 Tax=Exophiala xenobiotica TaxID=348802 RepID=A0A0D2CP62_9EURO|nr:uncharacterized protein PV05_10428 [Exophiala xenobiotica]KIW51742.1 hypothetical protein PV05_10428 [Exophiala xenobiotica]
MSNQMTKSDASRIQSSQYRAHRRASQAKSGSDMSSSGFAARAQSAGDRNANVSNNSGAQRSGGANQQSNASSKK